MKHFLLQINYQQNKLYFSIYYQSLILQIVSIVLKGKQELVQQHDIKLLTFSSGLRSLKCLNHNPGVLNMFNSGDLNTFSNHYSLEIFHIPGYKYLSLYALWQVQSNAAHLHHFSLIACLTGMTFLCHGLRVCSVLELLHNVKTGVDLIINSSFRIV